MAKGLLFATVAVCLLASGHAILPLGDILGSISQITGTLTDTVGGLAGTVTGVVSGTVGGITNALSGILGGLTDTVNNLLGTVFKLLGNVVNALTNVVSTVTNVLNSTLDTALGAPLNAVTGLLTSLTNSISPAKIASALTAGLAPQLKAITDLVKQLGGTAGCVVNTALGNFSREILNGVRDTLKCATPLVKEVSNATKDVGNIVSNSVGYANTILKNITTCTTDAAKANPPSFGKIVNCLVVPVGGGVTEVTKILGQTTPVIQNALKTALGVPQCAQQVLTDKIKNVNSMINSIVKCATEKNISTTVSTLPDSVPDFKAIAEKAIETINTAFAAALSSNSPLATLLERLQKLKDVADKISPDAITAAVAKGVKGIQDAIDSLKKQAGSNIGSGVNQCFSTVQSLVNGLPTKAVQEISACAVSISPEAATFIAQAAELDIGLKTKSVEAGVNAFNRCSVYATATDNSAQKCFDAIIAEVKSYIVNQLTKINNAVDTANNLIKKAEDCLTSGLTGLDAAGQVIISKLKECLAKEGVNTQSQNLSAVIAAGRKDVEKFTLDFQADLSVFNNAKENIKNSVDYVSTITPEILETIIGPQVTTAKEAVSRVENALADNQNPEVKRCIETAKGDITKTDTIALEIGSSCLNKNKADAEALATELAAEEASLKSKLANAGADSEAKCKNSVSESAAKSCFENYKVALKADVSQAINRVQSLVDKAEIVVSASINCVNDASTEAPARIDQHLATLKTCLTAQGVDASTLPF